jgi:glucose dehydrogenase
VNHRHHLICLAAAAVAIGMLLVSGGSNLPIVGISAALLICPIVMGVVMWLLMRPDTTKTPDEIGRTTADHLHAGGR